MRTYITFILISIVSSLYSQSVNFSLYTGPNWNMYNVQTENGSLTTSQVIGAEVNYQIKGSSSLNLGLFYQARNITYGNNFYHQDIIGFEYRILKQPAIGLPILYSHNWNKFSFSAGLATIYKFGGTHYSGSRNLERDNTYPLFDDHFEFDILLRANIPLLKNERSQILISPYYQTDIEIDLYNSRFGFLLQYKFASKSLE